MRPAPFAPIEAPRPLPGALLAAAVLASCVAGLIVGGATVALGTLVATCTVWGALVLAGLRRERTLARRRELKGSVARLRHAPVHGATVRAVRRAAGLPRGTGKTLPRARFLETARAAFTGARDDEAALALVGVGGRDLEPGLLAAALRDAGGLGQDEPVGSLGLDHVAVLLRAAEAAWLPDRVDRLQRDLTRRLGPGLPVAVGWALLPRPGAASESFEAFFQRVDGALRSALAGGAGAIVRGIEPLRIEPAAAPAPQWDGALDPSLVSLFQRVHLGEVERLVFARIWLLAVFREARAADPVLMRADRASLGERLTEFLARMERGDGHGPGPLLEPPTAEDRRAILRSLQEVWSRPGRTPVEQAVVAGVRGALRFLHERGPLLAGAPLEQVKAELDAALVPR